MPRGSLKPLPLAGLLLAATPVAGAVGVQDPVPVRACVQLPDGPRCLELPAGAHLRSGAPTRDGWLAAGTLAAGRYRDLLLVTERRGAFELLPVPARLGERPRGGPALLMNGGELAGLAWLEGTHEAGLAVRASWWRRGRWSPPEEVAPPASRVALNAAALADGRWVLVWTEFDGVDDETLYTIGRPGSWRSPHRMHPDNDVPDIQPAIVATGKGALVTWSRFDGRDYRLHLARFDGRGWRELAVLPGRGSMPAEFHVAEGRIWLLYSSVVPEAWQALELDPRGAVVGRHTFAGECSERRPRFSVVGGEPQLEGLAAPSGAPSPQPSETPTGETFRYMAFGDSITAGKADECNGNCDDITCNNDEPQCGYPPRLATSAYLDCAANQCQVVNEGKGCETTGQGLTRIQNVLDDEGPWDVALLMEGTNDVCWQDVSNNTIEANLGMMESEAAERGVETLHASIIHINDEDICPSSLPDPEGRVADLRNRIRDNLANVDSDTTHRWWSDPWSELCPTQNCFQQHYADWGHPDCSGYDIMTDVFRDGVQARAVPGEVTALEPTGTTSDTSPTFRWNKEIPRDATWYQFQLDGPGGNLEDLWLAETETCAPWQCTLDLGVFPEGTYTWSVRGRDAAGRSPWVETTFTIQLLQPPGEATPIAPAGNIGDDRPTFTWQRESPILATDYEVEISDELAVIFDEVFPAFSSCVGTTCSVEPFAEGDPLAAGDYTWRVRGSNAAGNGPWTDPLAFTLIPGLIFLDGFESSDTSAWSQTQP